MHSENNLFEFL